MRDGSRKARLCTGFPARSWQCAAFSYKIPRKWFLRKHEIRGLKGIRLTLPGCTELKSRIVLVTPKKTR